MSSDFKDFMDIVGNLATAGALAVTIVTFWLVFRRTNKSKQFSIANDISNSFTEIEGEILKLPKDEAHEKVRKYRRVQYMNVWEWFGLLVKNKQITDETILEHFKHSLIRDHDTVFGEYPDLRDDKNEFPHFRDLYDKWKDR